MAGDVVDGLARMSREAQNKYLAAILSRHVRAALIGLDPERARIAQSRWDVFFTPEGMGWTRRFLNARIAAGKSESKITIMADPEDYAADLVAFLLDDANWA